MFSIAFKMLNHRFVRLLVTIVGLSLLNLLSVSLIGVVIGWFTATSSIIRSANADIWVFSEQATAFDLATPIPLIRLYQVRSIPGIESADAMITEWSIWQAPNGHRSSIELIGLDHSLTGAPREMVAGEPAVVHRSHSVIVDQLYLEQLGVEKTGDVAEILNLRAEVQGISRGIRTFTASPFVFTSLKSAREYTQVRDDAITHVMARCQDGFSPEDLCRTIEREIPHVEALPSAEFARRTSLYWMSKTGAGLTVVLVAILGFCVSILVASQMLFFITHENRSVYATLLALGFSRYKLSRVAVYQGLQLGAASLVLSAAPLAIIIHASAETAVAVEMNVNALLTVSVAHLAACVGASLLSVRSVFMTNPVLAFHA